MKKIVSAALLALATLNAPAAVASMTGAQIKDSCAAPSGSPAWGLCYGYISGAVDSLEALKQLKLSAPSLVCLPPTATAGQVVEVAKKYLDDHPEQLHYVASSVLLEALGKAFPCK